MTVAWIESVPVLEHFSQVADLSLYVPLPDNWRICVADVVNSSGAIEAGRYKAVNLAGAATIAAVANALDGDLPLFAFGGDGARLAVPPEQAEPASDALSRVALWSGRDLELELRVGMISVSAIRENGLDARVAFWQSSDNVRYAMFGGGGLEWAEKQLKSGAIGLPAAATDDAPDLTGLSCQWGEIIPRHGKILSLIVKQRQGGPSARFSQVASAVVSTLEKAECLSPVPANGPAVSWPSAGIALQARIVHRGLGKLLRVVRAFLISSIGWLVFKLDVRIGRFDPNRYRREIALNSDFRKFDDGLLMTVDCSPETATELRKLLTRASDEGIVRFGMHLQDSAMMTCFVPSVLTSDHVHFLDGTGGGYASAARQLDSQKV